MPVEMCTAISTTSLKSAPVPTPSENDASEFPASVLTPVGRFNGGGGGWGELGGGLGGAGGTTPTENARTRELPLRVRAVHTVDGQKTAEACSAEERRYNTCLSTKRMLPAPSQASPNMSMLVSAARGLRESR